MTKPNILFIMCDQLRYDTIAALGNSKIKTPNIDRLVKRGVSFKNAYSSCPVCIPARYTIRTGCEPYHTLIYNNLGVEDHEKTSISIEERCGKYLPRVMRELGYRTFGIGKFHTIPWNEDLGYETHIYSEEIFENKEQRLKDDYASFIASKHPEYNYIEQLHGERTEMYYIPQLSPLPAEITVEAWVADKAVENITSNDKKPYFGFVSFIGPHPPFAPPVPFNRMYNPDNMNNPISGDIAVDHMDEQIPWMNYLIWSEDINNSLAKIIKSRYYGEITYIDQCIGRILDAVERSNNPDNTLICFFSDHGDSLGDHNAWQKESFFDSSCKIPFLLSWPEKIIKNTISNELVSLTDLFGIATTAAGKGELRDGIDILNVLNCGIKGRNYLFGYHMSAGTSEIKLMIRDEQWKYIFMTNGGREQLFNLKNDPNEIAQLVDIEINITKRFRKIAIAHLRNVGLLNLADGDQLPKSDYHQLKKIRVKQFDISVEKNNYTIP